MDTIYWIQGLGDGEWRTLRRCTDHDEAIARMGPLLTDQRYREVRLVMAQALDGRIDYTTLVKSRNGEVVGEAPRGTDSPPAAPPAAEGRYSRVAVLAAVLVAAVAGGLAIAKYNPRLAIALYERAATVLRPDRPEPAVPRTVAARTEADFADRLFAAVDADDAAAVRRLMAARPEDLRLDELRNFVDDGWGTGPRAIVDYALLGGHLKAADALLSAGATPSRWLRRVVARNTGLAKLRPAIALLTEFGGN